MTDEQLETLIADIERVQHHANTLVDLQDFIDQIELSATIISYYGHHHPDTDDLQVRMIRRIAEMGSKLLRKTDEAIEKHIHGAACTAREIQAQRMRQQEKTAQCQHCTQYINLLQVIPSEVTT